MSISLASRYTNSISASEDYPLGSFKNETSPGYYDGTPLEKDWCNDIQGFLQSLLTNSNITSSGIPDTVLASDYWNALSIRANHSIEGMFGGYNCAPDVTGIRNTAYGDNALANIKTGYAITALGRRAGYSNESGIKNVYIGTDSALNHIGNGSVIIGPYSGSDLIDEDNIFRLQTDIGTLLSGDFSTGELITGGTLTIPSGGANITGTVAVTGNETVSGTFAVTGLSTIIQPMLILTEEQAYNVIGHEGAVATANTHYTRWLNKEILNTISGASWLYNSGESTFTLPSGTYHVVANTKMHRSGGIQFYVASSVDYTVPLIIGHMMGGSLTSGLEACSAIDGILTTSGATFKLRVKPQYSTSDRAFGVPLESEMGGSNTNFKNYYSTIRITKLA